MKEALTSVVIVFLLLYPLASPLGPVSASAAAGDLLVDGTQITLDGSHAYTNVFVRNGGRIVVGPSNSLELTVTGTFLVDASSAVLANAQANGPGDAPVYPYGDWIAGGGGAGYGGEGGQGDGWYGGGGPGGPSYGDASSGGAAAGSRGADGKYGWRGPGGGGGAGGLGGSRIVITASTIQIDGALRADGGVGGSYQSGGGGGSGGGITLSASQVAISGSVTANGGNGGPGGYGGGGGAGGRITVLYDALNKTGQVSATGGSGGISWGGWPSRGKGVDGRNGSVVFNPDSTPPTTTVALAGASGLNNWYTSDVQVTLTATDNPRGSGVARTEYSFNGRDWNPHAAPFTITNELTTTVHYRSTDNAGNVERVSRDVSYTQLDLSSVFNSDAYTSGRSYCWGGCTYSTNPGTVYTDAEYGAVPMDMKAAGANNVWLSSGNDRTYGFPTSMTVNTNIIGATNIWIAGLDGGWVYSGSPVEVRYVLDGQQYSQSYSPNDWCFFGTDPKLRLWLDTRGGCGDIAVARIDLPRAGTLSQVSVIDWQGVGGASIPVFAVTVGKATETFKSLALKIDKTPPTISGAATTAPNANGWYKTDVVVHFTASDATSGLASLTPDVTLSSEGANQQVTGTAADWAGNRASATVSGINIDRTPPSTTATASPGPNANGWNRTDVSVTLVAAGTLAGVARTEYNLDNAGWVTYAGPITITADGIHTLLYRSVDKADNQESNRSLTIQLDKTPPVVSISGLPIILEGTSASAVVTATDALSGLALDPSGPLPLDTATVGFHTVTVTATDKAGNSASATLTYTVWGVIGPFPPLEKNGVGKGQFKAGSTIPVKFQITNGTGLITDATGTVTIGSASAPFRWDATAQQYVANVKTGVSGTFSVVLVVAGVGSKTIATVDLR